MKLGLVGKNINYSYSKIMHETMGNQCGIDIKYDIIDVPDLSDIHKIFNEYNGINVTIPYKEEIIKYLDFVDPLAEKIGAVNTIVMKNNKTYGYNTDYEGFSSAVGIKYPINVQKALIIGAGGAAKAVINEFATKGIETYITNRSKEKATQLSSNFISKEKAENRLREFDIIVNATPIGQDGEEMPLSLDNLNEKSLVVDLIYNPYKTLWLEKAESLGASTLNGLPMLAYQGVIAFKHFTDAKFDNKDALKILENAIQRKDIEDKVKERLSEMRFKHSVSVANTAVEIAKKYGLDEDVLYISGILHDYAKEISEEEILEHLSGYMPLENINKSALHSYHGYVGAIMAIKDFELTDRRIINAIKYHVFGSAKMDEYAKVIYCADYIEPGRSNDNYGIEEARMYAYSDLDEACLHILHSKNKYVLEKGNRINKDSLEFEKKLKELKWKK